MSSEERKQLVREITAWLRHVEYSHHHTPDPAPEARAADELAEAVERVAATLDDMAEEQLASMSGLDEPDDETRDKDARQYGRADGFFRSANRIRDALARYRQGDPE